MGNTDKIGREGGGGGSAYAVIGTHVHVHTLESHGGTIQVEVDAPEGGAKGVGEPRLALIVEGIRFAQHDIDIGAIGEGLSVLKHVCVD